MRYHVLATDYDGTLAHDGLVDDGTIEMLNKFLATGRHLVMVTGRELPDLMQTFPRIDLFEWIVAENGGLLYRPATKEEFPLADPPSQKFIDALQAKDVAPISIGRVIVATWQPHEAAVLEVIRDLGLEMQVIFNKGAVMILPAGVNKASGLIAALKKMGVSPHDVIGVGDAENDHAFLRICEMSVAVANALPAVKETADFVTRADHGAGVSALIEKVIVDDMIEFDGQLSRHYLALGKSGDQEIAISPYGRTVLICGPSASGKSMVTTRLVESLRDQKYQFCLIDPEGDYGEFEGAVIFGGPKSKPAEDELTRLLADPAANAVVCLTGMPIPDRPPFFLKLLTDLLQMRSRTGRPHWLILDEAHHLMPAEWVPPGDALPRELTNLILVTVHPDLLSNSLLERVNTFMVFGEDAEETLQRLAQVVNQPLPVHDDLSLESGELVMWMRDNDQPLIKLKPHPCETEHQRHRRKYSEGELPPDRSFYFRGPEQKMNLRAQNLMLFLQLADGVDDETWEYHLRNGDYSKWFRDSIKDDGLTARAERIEKLPDISPTDSRQLIRAAIEEDYTVPASAPLPLKGAS